jgi:hypothetical protein
MIKHVQLAINIAMNFEEIRYNFIKYFPFLDIDNKMFQLLCDIVTNVHE